MTHFCWTTIVRKVDGEAFPCGVIAYRKGFVSEATLKRFQEGMMAANKIDRTREKVVVYIYAERVGIIIGKKGAEVDKLTKDLENLAHRHIGH